MPPALTPEARAAVLTWFDARGRDLTFRVTRDPYAILVSEVMAQQTQVSRVAEAWPRFLERFPTAAALADASPADVLRAWRGMGYDRRALNLHRSARAIVAEHGGEVPSDLATLERLPGIGPYTARAVASIAFGSPVGAVDTNVRRVLGRVLVGADGLPRKELQAAADASVDPVRPGAWTHAVMDVGATLCHPSRPLCAGCPLQPWCRFASATADSTIGPRVQRARTRTRTRTRTGTRVRARTPARPPIPFHATSRWLRGRLVDRLRDAEGPAWTEITAPIGSHDTIAVDRALAALARDGVVELDAGDTRKARLAAV
jgi:A/G-specific adenine glycosylase